MKNKKPVSNKPELVIVEWHDAWSHDGWMGEDEGKEEAVRKANVITVGFIVNKDKESIAISQGIGFHKDQIGYSGLFVIPNGIINKITKIEY